MERSLELFEDISAYEIIAKKKLSNELFSPLGILIEGITDFQNFSNSISINSKPKTIKIHNELAFSLFDTEFDFFNRHIKPELKICHYNIYSIFLKRNLSNNVLRQFKNINENFVYLYFKDNNINSQKKYYSQKAKEIKYTLTNPKKYLYGFDNFSDLIEFYIEIIKEGEKWPVFVIWPLKVKYDSKMVNIKNDTTSTIYPIFKPISFLYYLSFTEKNLPKPKRFLNANEIYSVSKIRDAQISHKYESNSTIRTFLGFDTKFRCLYVFDFFVNQQNENEKMFDFKLVDEINFTIPKTIKSDLYYLEFRSIFDSSILFSIDFKESFNFLNGSDGCSTFLSFENQQDFLVAKKLFSSFVSQNYFFKKMRIIEKEELSLLFPSSQFQTNLFYIMFQIKSFNKNHFSKLKLPNLTSFFKGSIITKKDNICSLDNKNYIIVGFVNVQRRNDAFQLLVNSQHLITLRSYYFPEKIKQKNIHVDSNLNIRKEEKVEPTVVKSKEPLFYPKEGLFYIYFQEYQKSKIHYPSNIVRPLFGLQNISDLRRNYYLPNDPNEYTFIGFSNIEYYQKALNDTSPKTNPLITNVLNGRIYDYQNNQEKIVKIDNYIKDDEKKTSNIDNSSISSNQNKTNDDRFHWSNSINNNIKISKNEPNESLKSDIDKKNANIKKNEDISKNINNDNIQNNNTNENLINIPNENIQSNNINKSNENINNIPSNNTNTKIKISKNEPNESLKFDIDKNNGNDSNNGKENDHYGNNDNKINPNINKININIKKNKDIINNSKTNSNLSSKSENTLKSNDNIQTNNTNENIINMLNENNQRNNINKSNENIKNIPNNNTNTNITISKNELNESLKSDINTNNDNDNNSNSENSHYGNNDNKINPNIDKENANIKKNEDISNNINNDNIQNNNTNENLINIPNENIQSNNINKSNENINNIPNNNTNEHTINIPNNDINKSNDNVNNNLNIINNDSNKETLKLNEVSDDDKKDIKFISHKTKKANKLKKEINEENNINYNNNEDLEPIMKLIDNDTKKYIVNLKDYKKITNKTIGSGGYGSVYLVEDIHTHKKYAAKTKNISNHNYQDLLQEIKFYTTYKDINILSLHGFSLINFNNEPEPILILEYMPNNSLEDFLNKKPSFIHSMMTKKYPIIIGIIRGLLFLHNKGVVHRDIKPANILLDENYYPRISDFGSSIIYQDVEQHAKQREKNVGSCLYMAPEIFLDKEPYSYKVDIYSFALVAYQLLTEKKLYSDKKFAGKNHFKKCVIEGLRPDLSIIPDDEIRAFFERCWSSEPSERPTIKEIFDIFNTSKFQQAYHFDANEDRKYHFWYSENNEGDKFSLAELRKSYLQGDIQSSISYANHLYFNGRKIEATQIMKKIAEKNNYEAMYWYSIFLRENHSKSDLKTMNIYLKKAADHGFDKAMIDYGNNLLIGFGIKQNFTEAARYYKMAADLHNPEGMFNYGTMLNMGRGILTNKKEACHYFKLAADLGNVNAMYQYAFNLKLGDGVKRDIQKAVEYYEKAIFLGDIEAMSNLGLLYNDGSLPIDFQKSAYYLKKASDLENLNGMFNYGNLLCNMALTGNYNDEEKEELFEKAASIFKKAADMGNIEAGTQYGYIYTRGFLQNGNMDEITRYLKKSAYQDSEDAIIEYGLILYKKNESLFNKFIIDLIIKGYSRQMVDNFIIRIKRYFINEMLLKKTEKEYNDKINAKKNNTNQNNTDGFVNLNDNNNNNEIVNLNDSDDNETIDKTEIMKEIIKECQKNNLSFNETTYITSNIKKRLEHKFVCNNNKSNDNEDKLTKSLIRSLVKNLIGTNENQEEEEEQEYRIPDLKGKSIHELKVNSYNSYEFVPFYYLIYISHFTVPETVRNEIDRELKTIKYFSHSEKNLCHQKDPNDIYDFYYFTPFISVPLVQKTLNNLMNHKGIKSFISNIQETLPFENYLYFDEKIIPSETLEFLIKFLINHKDVKEIKRNIFDGKQIATHIILKNDQYDDVIKSIRKLLIQQRILFESYKYPLQNNIIINEKMILKDKNDFYLILNEIKSLNIKPLKIERDKLYMYDLYFVRKLFQRFSFICFKNEIEKMEVVNHLNSIIFKNEKDVLQYDIELHYASIDDHFYPKNVRDQIPKIFNSFKGIKDFQPYVLSIENPVRRTYIGFDTIKHLKKCHYKFIYKLNVLLTCFDPKLFWRKKNLLYIYFRSKNKFSSDFDDYIDCITSLVDDIQINRTDLEYKTIWDFEQVYTTYLGFENTEKLEKALNKLSKKQIPNRSKVEFGKYKEGKKLINVSYETRELYLFYESL